MAHARMAGAGRNGRHRADFSPSRIYSIDHPEGLTMWQRIKTFFKDSETIFLARAQALIGFVAAIAGAMDWGPLVGLASNGGFTRDQIVGLAVVLAVQGLLTEVLRRRRDPEL